ncbi:MAG: hypothetical protein ACKPA9_09885 [Microcystis sp.]
MYINLTTDEAVKLLKKDDNASWSWDGALSLVQYLEDLEDSTNTKIEFDPILFRCEYSEYPSVLKAGENYSFIPPEDSDHTIKSRSRNGSSDPHPPFFRSSNPNLNP